MKSAVEGGTPKICVVGLGYIGLPTAAVLATTGFRVHGIDVKTDIVDGINSGNIHIKEPGLEELVRAAVRHGKLTAHLEPVEAGVFLIVVPTPFLADHKPDMSHVENAVKAIAPHLKKGDLVILESTCPVGSTDDVERFIFSLRPDLRRDALFVAYCPERVLPGRILKELTENDRVVGGTDAKSTEKAAEFYRRFVSGRVFETNAKTAEMCKLAENSFRDVNIAFANELSVLCDATSIDVRELISLANRHPRVQILTPGPGVGGHCIAVDPWFIVEKYPEMSRLIRCARDVNDKKILWVINKIRNAVDQFREENSCEPQVSIYGLTFKPDVDDVRESPAIKIVKGLAEHLKFIRLYEPNINVLPTELREYKNISLEIEAGKIEGDLVIVLVNHSQLKLAKFPSAAKVIDFCSQYDGKTTRREFQ